MGLSNEDRKKLDDLSVLIDKASSQLLRLGNANNDVADALSRIPGAGWTDMYRSRSAIRNEAIVASGGNWPPAQPKATTESERR